MITRWFTMSPDDGDAGGGTGDTGQAGDTGTVDVEAQIKSAVEKEVAGLKAKNSELLGKLKGVTETLNQAGGAEGVAELAALRERLAADEAAQLLKDGKLDEYKQQVESTAQNRIEAAEKRAREAHAELEARQAALHKKDLEASVRAAAANAGIQPSAVDDVVLNAHAVFKHDDDGKPVIRDEKGGVVVDDNGAPVGVAAWIAARQDDKRHWWGPSQGAGAQGGGGAGRESVDVTREATSFSEWEKKRKALGVQSAQERSTTY